MGPSLLEGKGLFKANVEHFEGDAIEMGGPRVDFAAT